MKENLKERLSLEEAREHERLGEIRAEADEIRSVIGDNYKKVINKENGRPVEVWIFKDGIYYLLVSREKYEHHSPRMVASTDLKLVKEVFDDIKGFPYKVDNKKYNTEWQDYVQDKDHYPYVCI